MSFQPVRSLTYDTRQSGDRNVTAETKNDRKQGSALARIGDGRRREPARGKLAYETE